MEIMELAVALGQKIKVDQRYVKYLEAQSAYEKDESLKELMKELDIQQKALAIQMQSKERDTYCIDTIQERINQIYEQLKNNEHVFALNEAQKEMNELMNSVNSTITAQLTGGEQGCTHNCATCHGCK